MEESASSGVTWSRLAVTVSVRSPENTRFFPVISARVRMTSMAGAPATWRLKSRLTGELVMTAEGASSLWDGCMPPDSSSLTMS